jgi:hypothetical protein
VEADSSVREHDEGSAEGDTLRDSENCSKLSGMHFLLLYLLGGGVVEGVRRGVRERDRRGIQRNSDSEIDSLQNLTVAAEYQQQYRV